MHIGSNLLVLGSLAFGLALPALGRDKGDTYVYTGFVTPDYSLTVDSITAKNEKGKPQNADGSPNTTPESQLE